MNILAVSDVLLPFVYSPQVRTRFANKQMVIGCGDLPYYYQEYILNMLDVPLFYVRGNHDPLIEHAQGRSSSSPEGGTDLHRKVICHDGFIIAGVEGSLRYRDGDFQYTQNEMWGHVFHMIPMMFFNRIFRDRYLDIFVTHAPPQGIHDRSDLPHQGIRAFRWLVETFQPAVHIHGHVHLYRPEDLSETIVRKTRVINAFGYREITVPDQRQIKTGLRASRKT
jgi:Icc-related predicted phosphoesterase